MDPGYKDMLVKLNEWYGKSWIDKESFIYQATQLVDLIKLNRVGVFMGWYSRITLNEAELKKQTPAANYVIAPIKGPKGYIQTVNAITMYRFGASGGTGGYVVNRNSKNPGAVIKLFDWAFTPENYIISRYGLENEAWRWVDKSKGVFEFIGTPMGFGDELAVSKGVPEFWVRERVSANEKHTAYLTDGTLKDFSFSKWPKDGGLHFDTTPLMEAGPNTADMGRFVEEESIKFITGARPFGEYDRFLTDLNRLGIEKLSDEITRQYNILKK
jgi:putative aldouronate transport system substrate-binding protein